MWCQQRAIVHRVNVAIFSNFGLFLRYQKVERKLILKLIIMENRYKILLKTFIQIFSHYSIVILILCDFLVSYLKYYQNMVILVEKITCHDIITSIFSKYQSQITFVTAVLLLFFLVFIYILVSFSLQYSFILQCLSPPFVVFIYIYSLVLVRLPFAQRSQIAFLYFYVYFMGRFQKSVIFFYSFSKKYMTI